MGRPLPVQSKVQAMILDLVRDIIDHGPDGGKEEFDSSGAGAGRENKDDGNGRDKVVTAPMVRCEYLWGMLKGRARRLENEGRTEEAFALLTERL